MGSTWLRSYKATKLTEIHREFGKNSEDQRERRNPKSLPSGQRRREAHLEQRRPSDFCLRLYAWWRDLGPPPPAGVGRGCSCCDKADSIAAAAAAAAAAWATEEEAAAIAGAVAIDSREDSAGFALARRGGLGAEGILVGVVRWWSL